MDYYENGKKYHVLHEDTRALLELLLEMLSLKGEQEVNQFIRNEVLTGKLPYERAYLEKRIQSLREQGSHVNG